MAKIKTLDEIGKMKKEASDIVAEAKRKEKEILKKVSDEEKEVFAEIGKKAVQFFNKKLSEDDFKKLLIKNNLLEKVEDESEKGVSNEL